MARKLRRATFEQTGAIGEAVTLLAKARDLLVSGGAPRAAAKVRRALKSADGAHRHALRARFGEVFAAPAARKAAGPILGPSRDASNEAGS